MKFHNQSINLVNVHYLKASLVERAVAVQRVFCEKRRGGGVKVLVPKSTTYFERRDKEVQLKFATREEKEKIEKKVILTYTRTYFDIGHVFEVSQTNARQQKIYRIFFLTGG